MRAVDQNLAPGKISSISGKSIDLSPTIAVTGKNQVWWTWDSPSGTRQKLLCIGNPTIGVDLPPEETASLRIAKKVCTPAFVQKPGGGLVLLWCETDDSKQWQLEKAELDPAANRWSQAQTIESQDNPRFVSGAYDKQGRLLIAYSGETQRGREIFVRALADASR